MTVPRLDSFYYDLLARFHLTKEIHNLTYKGLQMITNKFLKSDKFVEKPTGIW